jgi:hypothetical protein
MQIKRAFAQAFLWTEVDPAQTECGNFAGNALLEV